MKLLKNRIKLKKNYKHTIEVIIDKIPLVDLTQPITKKEFEKRLNEAIETAVDLSNGLCMVAYPWGDPDSQAWESGS